MLCYASAKLENRLKVTIWSGILPNWHPARIFLHFLKQETWVIIRTKFYENPPRNTKDMKKKNKKRYFFLEHLIEFRIILFSLFFYILFLLSTRAYKLWSLLLPQSSLGSPTHFVSHPVAFHATTLIVVSFLHKHLQFNYI